MKKHALGALVLSLALVLAPLGGINLKASAEETGQETASVLGNARSGEDETLTVDPTTEPSAEPSEEPTAEPSAEPTVKPSAEPTAEPSAEPTAEPSAEPTAEPSAEPTTKPSVAPTTEPTVAPTSAPTVTPTIEPSAAPTTEPTVAPTSAPTVTPTTEPTATPVAKTPLAAPTGVTWGDNYELQFKEVENCKSYRIEVYRDGVQCYSSSYGWSNSANSASAIRFSVFMYNLNQSGTYKFRVMANAANDDTEHSNSEWSEWSEEKTYVKPDEQIGETKAYWDTVKAGVVYFEEVENAGRYAVDLYRNGHLRTTVYTTGGSGQMRSTSFSWDIEKYGAGKYQVCVRAISVDVDTYANGSAGEMSDIYDTTVTADALKNTLSEAIANQTPEEAAETLKGSVDISAIQMAMQTDDNFRGQVAELEKSYAETKGITTDKNVSEAAKEYVDSDQVKMVGAAFNAVGNNVKLDVGLTPEENKVPLSANYLNSVQFDIKLVSGDTEVHKLDVPISITMPVPKGFKAAQLVILHYHQDGTVERASFHVNDDGTITFTVKEFSNFVFVGEEGDDTGNGGDNTDSDNTGNGDNNTGNDNAENGGNDTGDENNGDNNDEEVSAPAENTSAPKSPKTGAENTPYMVFAIACAALTGSVATHIYKKKKTS